MTGHCNILSYHIVYINGLADGTIAAAAERRRPKSHVGPTGTLPEIVNKYEQRADSGPAPVILMPTVAMCHEGTRPCCIETETWTTK